MILGALAVHGRSMMLIMVETLIVFRSTHHDTREHQNGHEITRGVMSEVSESGLRVTIRVHAANPRGGRSPGSRRLWGLPCP